MKEKSEKKLEELNPNQIVRVSDGTKYFGYKHTHLAEKIKSGEIPAPIKLSEGGRAVGWLGEQILQWQAARIAAAKRA